MYGAFPTSELLRVSSYNLTAPWRTVTSHVLHSDMSKYIPKITCGGAF